MSRITAKIRRQRRRDAPQLLTAMGPLLFDFRINDAKGSHITLWATPDVRIEWWPGTARWRGPDGKMRDGTPVELGRFVLALERKSSKPVEASELVEALV